MEMIDKLRELNKKLDDPYFVKEFEEDFEKFLKERDMKVYHVETQEAYDELMSEFEEKGYKWLSGREPTEKNYWEQNKESSCVIILGKYIVFMNIEQSKKKYPNIPIIEYKAKGENMTEEEMKRYFLNESRDVSIAIENFVIDDSTTENTLSKAKSSAKKLIEKIDEYLESQKSKFEVRDYVTVFVDDRKKIAKIDALRGNKKEAHGLWYDKTKVNVKQDYWVLAEWNKFRPATPEEITEYEVALNFHKHGRKPFELKRGDIVYLKGYDKNIFLDSGNIYKKHNFIDGDVALVKTVEEVNEWLEK